MKKTVALLLALLMVFALFAACGKSDTKTSEPNGSSGSKPNVSPDTDSPEKETTSAEQTGITVTKDKVNPSKDAVLKIAFSAEPADVGYVGNKYAAANYRAADFYQGLLGWDSATNQSVPLLAKSYEWIDDLTLRMKLEENVISIGGDPFTANDVIFTINWNLETPTMASYYTMFNMEKTKAVDDYTVDLVLNEPYPFLVTDLSHGAYHMAVEKSVERIGKEATKQNPAGGTGPYKPGENEPGIVYRAVRRDDYWGTMPYYASVEYWIIGDATTRIFGVETGDYLIAMTPPASAVLQAVKGEIKNAKGWFIPYVRFIQLRINSDAAPLHIKELRQAISLAINYEAIIQVACSGQAEFSDCLYPPRMHEYTPAGNEAENYIRYDPEAAKQKLIEAGYPDGLELTLVYRNNDTAVNISAELLQNHFKEVGINLKLDQMESAAYSSLINEGNFEITLAPSANPNPRRALWTIDPRKKHVEVSGSSGSKWQPEGFTELIDKCLNTVDDAERQKYFAEVNDIVREYVPTILVACPYLGFFTSDKIEGFSLTQGGGMNSIYAYEAGYLVE